MSYSTVDNLTWTGTLADESKLGMRKRFHVKDYITSRTTPSAYNSATCEAILVLNKSSGTLAKGSLVLPSTTASYGFPYATAGVSGTAFFCGAVSPWLTVATVADGAAYWLITEGLTQVPYSGSGAVTIGARVELAATGRATLYGTSSSIQCGYAREAINGSAAGTLFEIHMTKNGGA